MSRNFRKVAAAGSRRRGLTLVEMLVALSITAVVSTAVAAMLHAGAKVNSSLNDVMTSQWEMESAIMRITQLARVCTSLTVPTGVSGGTSFSLVTEPDAANGNATYTVTYALAPVNGANELQETDPRFGTSTLIHNVQSFDVRTKNLGLPQVVVLSITAGPAPAATRTFRIMPRNQ
jgi:prepilin-type N-terminal cleavage/methylation domain-containing protein